MSKKTGGRMLTIGEIAAYANAAIGSKETGQFVDGRFESRWFATLDGKPVGVGSDGVFHDNPEAAERTAVRFRAYAAEIASMAGWDL